MHDRYERPETPGERCLLFVGAFSKQNSTGIRSFRYHMTSHQLSFLGTYGDYNSMSCLVTDGDLLIACVESPRDDLLVAFRIHEDGVLEQLNASHIGGCSIAHLSVDRNNHYIYAASMASASIHMIRYAHDGSLVPTDRFEFTDPGSFEVGRSNERQKASRIHYSQVMPDGRHLAVCNLGSDKVYIMEIDQTEGKLKLLPKLTVPVAGGEGPRHFVFSPNGKIAYMNTEMGNRIYVFKIGENGALELLQTISTLDPDDRAEGKKQTSVSAMTGDGRYLLIGNRGQNNIAVFEVGADGLLRNHGFYDCFGEEPRGLSLDGGEETLFCCCNGSGTLAVIEFDKKTGTPGKCLQLLEGVPGAANAVLCGSDN